MPIAKRFTSLKELLVLPLSERLRVDASCALVIGSRLENVTLRPAGRGLVGRAGPLEMTLLLQDTGNRTARATLEVQNVGPAKVTFEVITLLELAFVIDPKRDLPRTRHMRGSWHYDACYPPRAFVLEEHLHASADHSKRVEIGGINASVFSPALQFAIGTDRLYVVQLGLEWSGSWEISAGWAAPSFRGEPSSDFTVNCRLGLGVLALEPGCTDVLPTLHFCSTSGRGWSPIDDRWRSYLRDDVAAASAGSTRFPVSYDHWFGINERFDVELLLRQAQRAADIGCEYFCLDAAWYKSGSFEDGLGNWTTPDAGRFPRGYEDLKALSSRVRELGMGMGLWHVIQVGQPGTDLPTKAPQLYRPTLPSSTGAEALARYGSGDSYTTSPTIDGLRLALETEDGVQLALDTLGSLIRELSLTWMRFETVPEDGLAYNRGLYRLFEAIREIAPNLYIEACSGGGQSLDLGMISRANGAWLSDHTTVPSVTRYCQSGALRWHPPEYLNMAVTSSDGGPRSQPYQGGLLSRMVGTLSFNGDVAAWSDSAARLIRSSVDHFKEIREDRGITVRFPFGQPRAVEDWDAVAFPDAAGGDLLYVFRDLGPTCREISSLGDDDFSVDGDWALLVGDEGAAVEQRNGRCTVEMPPWSGALFQRQGR